MRVVLRSPQGLLTVSLHAERPPRLSQIEGAELSLEEAWQRLAKYERGNARDEEALREIYRNTMPVAGSFASLPLPRSIDEKPTVRRSAAHPRGFKGTISKPPKVQTERIDLRPYLSRWDTAARLVGLSEAHPFLERLVSPIDFDGLDERLREALSVLVTATADELGRFDRALRRLGVSVPERYLLLQRGNIAERLSVLEGVLAAPPEKRRLILNEWNHQEVSTHGDSMEEMWSRLYAFDGDVGDARLKHFFEQMRRGSSPRYVVSGIELAREFPVLWSEGWTSYHPGYDDNSELIRRAAWRVPSKRDDEKWPIAYGLYHAFGKNSRWRDFVAVLLEIPSMSEEELTAWLALPQQLRHETDLGDPVLDILPAAMRERERLAESLRLGFARQLLEGAHAFRKASSVAGLVELALKAAPFSSSVMVALAKLHEEGLRLPMDERTLRALSVATTNSARAELLYNGLRSLLSVAPDWCADLCDNGHASMLFRLAGAIGAAHPERTKRVLRSAMNDAMWSVPESADEVQPLLIKIELIGPQLIAKSLRDTSLSESKRLGRLEKIRMRWNELRIALVDRYVEEDLQRSVTASPRMLSSDERHALELLSRAGEHRRPLARVLRAVFSASTMDTSCDSSDVYLFHERLLLGHHETQVWLRKHSRIDRERLVKGIALQGFVEGFGEVTWAVERSLLAVLQMGDYVNTCLALGEQFDSDPAGIALDLNKRIVLLRDANGRVLARQLVAISAKDELVCYPPYFAQPVHHLETTLREAAKKEILDGFHDYDCAFASLLAIEVAKEDDDIEFILARLLWSDLMWDRFEKFDEEDVRA